MTSRLHFYHLCELNLEGPASSPLVIVLAWDILVKTELLQQLVPDEETLGKEVPRWPRCRKRLAQAVLSKMSFLDTFARFVRRPRIYYRYLTSVRPTAAINQRTPLPDLGIEGTQMPFHEEGFSLFGAERERGVHAQAEYCASP